MIVIVRANIHCFLCVCRHYTGSRQHRCKNHCFHVVRIKEACHHSSACLLCWLPPSDHLILQAQNGPRPMNVNLQTACPRMMNVWRYSKFREQELKAQYFNYLSFIKYSERKRRVNDYEACASICYLLLGCQDAFGSEIPLRFCYFNVCFLFFSLKFYMVFCLWPALQGVGVNTCSRPRALAKTIILTGPPLAKINRIFQTTNILPPFFFHRHRRKF